VLQGTQSGGLVVVATVPSRQELKQSPWCKIVFPAHLTQVDGPVHDWQFAGQDKQT
jgi:hypothetical protein